MDTFLPLPPTIQEVGYCLAGFVAARAWNVLKRLWLYRYEALPGHYNYRTETGHNWAKWASDVPAYLWLWLRLGFNWFDPYLGEPKALLRWL